MQILQDLSIFWAMFHVIFLFVMLFRSRYNQRKTRLFAGIGMGALMGANVALLAVLGFDTLSKLFLFTCSIPSFVFFYVMSADKRFRFLLTFCLADTTCLWIMAVTNLLDFYLGGGRYILMFVSRLLAFPLIEYGVYRFLRKLYLELQDGVKKGWGIFAGMTMLYYVLLVVVVQFPTNIIHRPEDTFLCVLVLILMIFNYGTIFLSLYGQLQVYRKQQSELILQEQKNSLEMQLENQQNIRRMKHDMKAHTVTLSGLLATGNTQEALKYLEGVKMEMESVTGQFCANPYINAVLIKYAQRAEHYHIQFRTDIKVGEEEIPYMELCQILSNGLENACDALVKLQEEERELSIQMKYSRAYLVVRIKNRCQKELQVRKGEIPGTGKEGHGHGFGLPTVQEAAKRLNGDMLCYTDNGYFILDVMVQVKNAVG